MLRIFFLVLAAVILTQAGTLAPPPPPPPAAAAAAGSPNDPGKQSSSALTLSLNPNLDINDNSSTSSTIPSTSTTDSSTTVPTTTTTVSTTTVSTTTSTTSTSTSTTTSTTTTTTPPPVTPTPIAGKWNVSDDQSVCILARFATLIDLTYTTTLNTTEHRTMSIPPNATAKGSCGKTEQTLILSWPSAKGLENNFTLHFVNNQTAKRYSLHHFELLLPTSEFPNINTSNPSLNLTHTTASFVAGLSNSYRCLKRQMLDVKEANNGSAVGHLEVSDLQLQAFRSDNSTTFGLATDCSFDMPDVVPIAVGCALAGLVVIVLVAYLVGRRRSQARGYLSM